MSKKSQSSAPKDLTREQLIAMFRRMLLIRGFEARAKQYFEAREIAGFLHLSVGQEAVSVGACSALRKDDYITSTHRGHGDVIAKGCEPKFAFAELFGRTTGYCKGKGGSMHIADFSQGIIGATGIVSGALPTAPGIGLSIKMRKTDQVAVCFFGDGATAEGGFHEAMNLASLWQIPLIFVCANNLYGLTQPWEKTAYKCELPRRAATYNMASACVDGMDVVAVNLAVREAVARARKGGGPTFIEAKTYRYWGHYVGDPGTYMPEEEQKEWRARDAIESISRRLQEWGYTTPEEDQQIRADVDAELDAGIEFARQSPLAEPESALSDVYSQFDVWGNPL